MISTEDLDDQRALHQPMNGPGPSQWCQHDGEQWPCTVTQLLDEHLLRQMAEAVFPSGIGMITAERVRQVVGKGYTPEHDAEHDQGELLEAALCYAVAGGPRRFIQRWPWPGDEGCKRPGPDPVQNLVKAAALLAAEIDRLLAAL
jgi:hypothetical protein